MEEPVLEIVLKASVHFVGIATTRLTELFLRAYFIFVSTGSLTQVLLLQDEVGKGVSEVAVSVSGYTCHKSQDPLSSSKFPHSLISHLQIVFHFS